MDIGEPVNNSCVAFQKEGQGLMSLNLPYLWPERHSRMKLKLQIILWILSRRLVANGVQGVICDCVFCFHLLLLVYFCLLVSNFLCCGLLLYFCLLLYHFFMLIFIVNKFIVSVYFVYNFNIKRCKSKTPVCSFFQFHKNIRFRVLSRE